MRFAIIAALMAGVTTLTSFHPVPARADAPPAVALPGQEPVPQDPPKQDGIGIVQGATLAQLVEACQKQTGKRFMYDDAVGATLAQKKAHVLIPQGPRDNEEYFAIFQSILQVNGLALIPVGKPGEEIHKIVPAVVGQKNAFKEASPVVKESGTPNDSFVTRVFTLKYVSASEVQRALMQLTATPAFAAEQAGAIIITDYDYNIKRMEELIATLDVKRPDIQLEMIQLQHSLASDVEQMLNGLMQTLTLRSPPRGVVPGMPGVPGQEQAKIAADKRTNSLLVLAEPVRMEQIRDLVKKLDTEALFETSGIYISHLRHTNAIDISKTLNAMYRIPVDTEGMPSSSSGSGSTAAKPGQPVSTVPGQPVSTVPGPPGASSPPTGLTGAEPTIVPDQRSNSVILVTDRNTATTLQNLIKRLDMRRPQVLIKATVVEVSAESDFDLGVELNRAVDPEGRVTTIGRSQFGLSTIRSSGNTFDVVPLDTTGLTLALVHDRIGNIGFMIKALSAKANVQILDEPEAATVDNGTASMSVTASVPVLETTITGTGVAQTTFKEFATAETKLTISPHISEGGYLRLDTTIKIEKFQGAQLDPTVPPAKSSREINTTSILVPNGRTVVIGGIVTSDADESETKIPLLGDIPLLGQLFRRNQRSSERRTLYIFITPHILYDDSFADFKELTRDRKINIEDMRGSLQSVTLDGRGEPVPQSAFRYRAPGEQPEEEKR